MARASAGRAARRTVRQGSEDSEAPEGSEGPDVDGPAPDRDGPGRPEGPAAPVSAVRAVA